MRILLIANYLPDQQQSMLRYAEMLERELRRREWDVAVVRPPVILGGFSFLRGSLKKWVGYIDKYLLAPVYLRSHSLSADIVHICDHSNSMYLRCAGARPVLITCHDLLAVRAARGAFAQIKTGLTGRLLQRWILSRLSQAKNIVCVSEKTREDLKLLAPHTQAEIRVIYHALNWSYAPAAADAIAAIRKNSGLDAEAAYLLHVGGNQWYKGRLHAMKIFASLRQHPRFQKVKLIMAGKPWTEPMRAYCELAGLTGAIIERTNISNEELQALYSGALALLFPSLEEGFGWPVLEAQACGCPVITSNRKPMTEIAGDAALFIDPEMPEEAARLIAEFAPHLASLRDAGFNNLRRFDADTMIENYQNFYKQIVQNGVTRAVD